MHASLGASHPEWQVKITRDRQGGLGFANGSRFRALASTKRMGRGEAAFGTLADEAAFWAWPAEQFAALEAASANMHLITTGNGPGDYVEALWRSADQPGSPWRKAFLPWHAHPRRSAAWYESMVEHAAEPRLAHREYAATPEEAFAAPEGMFFERFDAERNAPRIMPPQHNWETWRAVDFGFHWPACLWIQISPAGQPIVIAELARRETFNWTTAEFADRILKMDGLLGLFEVPRGTYCDPAGKGVQSQTGDSEFRTFQIKGLTPIACTSSRHDGCVRIMNALADPNLPLVVSKSCKWLIEGLGAVSPDKGHPDVYDEKSDYRHALDALRYFFVNRPVGGSVDWVPGNYDALPDVGGGIYF
jgi:hypothetical protein